MINSTRAGALWVAGESTARQDRTGQGRAGQGRAGQGRAGQVVFVSSGYAGWCAGKGMKDRVVVLKFISSAFCFLVPVVVFEFEYLMVW
ncbi:hypothetical protein E2C01_084882 [Portunus trituberculatus]|uniref:Uncharacterized protein n=1 Tax=Portunus trituberculatus TaxID=210409 RepID=A0A5B7JAG1_PORTR|nr:hypothetical protein [Portunus trituberculatus]